MGAKAEKARNMVGQRFGLLTVLKAAPKDPDTGKSKWVCQCECGERTTAVGYRLATGNTRSCGCLRRKGERVEAPIMANAPTAFIPTERERRARESYLEEQFNKPQPAAEFEIPIPWMA